MTDQGEQKIRDCRCRACKDAISLLDRERERSARLGEVLKNLSDEAVTKYGAGPTADFIVSRVAAALEAEEEA